MSATLSATMANSMSAIFCCCQSPCRPPSRSPCLPPCRPPCPAPCWSPCQTPCRPPQYRLDDLWGLRDANRMLETLACLKMVSFSTVPPPPVESETLHGRLKRGARHEMILIQMLCMENTSEMKKIYDGRWFYTLEGCCLEQMSDSYSKRFNENKRWFGFS